jgi:hypothetical protein
MVWVELFENLAGDQMATVVKCEVPKSEVREN